MTTDDAGQLPHKLTLVNDDSSYSKTLALASDCKAGDSDGTSMLTFEDLTEDHVYTLQCDNGTLTYSLFENLSYHEIVEKLAAQGNDAPDATQPPDPSWDMPDATVSGDTGTNADSATTDGTNTPAEATDAG